MGNLVVNWNITGGRIEFELEIPVGTEAELALPSGTTKYMLEGSEHVIQTNEKQGISLKSGKYKISYAV
jgi:hypothetical protein